MLYSWQSYGNTYRKKEAYGLAKNIRKVIITLSITSISELQTLADTATNEEEKNALLEVVQNMKKSLILSVHTHAITYLENEARYQTYAKLSTGKRKCIKAKTEEELYRKLWEFYGFEGVTLHDLFYQWLAYKKNMTGSTNTVDRYTQYFHKYLESSALMTCTVQKVSKVDLQKELNRIVKDNSLTHKAWQNLKTVISGMFEYAMDHRLISSNVFLEVRILVPFRQVPKKASTIEVLNQTEYAAQKAYFYARFEETKDPACAAVLLQDFSGLRIGELVALKWSDLSGSNLTVEREEVYDSENSIGKRAYRIVSHTKTHKARTIYLPTSAVELLAKLPHTSEFIFSRDASRVTSRQVTYQLEKYAKTCGLMIKRSHKNRKTYASNLANNGVDLDTIRLQLGHADLRTTLGYIYETSPDHSASLIDSAV